MASDQQSRRDVAPSGEAAPARPEFDDAPGDPAMDSGPKRSRRGWGWRLALPLLLIAAAILGFNSALRTPPTEPERPVSNAGGKQTPEDEAPQTAQHGPSSPVSARVPLEPLTPETARGLIEEAERVADDLTERFPRNPDALEMLARFQFEFADVDRAVGAWQRCLELNPNYAYAHVGLARVATQRGDFAAAIAHYRRAVLADPRTLSHQIDLGKALLAAGEVTEASAVLDGVVKAAPDSASGHAELGAAQLQQRDYPAAKTSFETALRLDPGHVSAHFGLATALSRLGDVEQAAKLQATYNELRSNRKEAIRGERVAYDDKQALCEDIGLLYTRMAAVYLAEGDPGAAEQLWQRAARLDPENRDCRQALAWLMLQQQKPWDTIRLLRELTRLEPANDSYPAEIARLYCEIGRIDDAERALQDFAGNAPDSAAGQAALAEFYLNVKSQPQAAVPHARQAAELSGDGEHWILLSAAEELAGNLPAAVAALEEAVKVAPENLQYRQLLALLKARAAGQPTGDEVGPPGSERPAPP